MIQHNVQWNCFSAHYRLCSRCHIGYKFSLAFSLYMYKLTDGVDWQMYSNYPFLSNIHAFSDAAQTSARCSRGKLWIQEEVFYSINHWPTHLAIQLNWELKTTHIIQLFSRALNSLDGEGFGFEKRYVTTVTKSESWSMKRYTDFQYHLKFQSIE